MKVWGIVGWKNTGKTGLMERLVTEFTGRGLSVSTVKHAHHDFDVDQPGKDSFRHRQAGASEVLLASGTRWALMAELRGAEEPGLDDLLARLSPVDLVLVEGFKRHGHPKVEAHRQAAGKPLLAPGDPTVRAVASDVPLDLDRPVFDLDDTTAIADFIAGELGLTGFDTVVVVDWSARSKPSPAKPTRDAIFVAVSRAPGSVPEVLYFRTRTEAMAALTEILRTEQAAGRRVLAGFDFPFGYPRGFARAVTGSDDPFALWAALADRVADGPDNASNRWQVAGALNELFPGTGPFWGNGAPADVPGLPRLGRARAGHGMQERRRVEERLPRAFTCWQLAGAGAVGSQVLMGLPHLHRLREDFGDLLSVSPFQPPDTPIVLAEVYPSLLAGQVRAAMRDDDIPDAVQVRVLAAALHRLPAADLNAMLAEGDPEEGWILGVGHEAMLTGPA